MSKEAMKLALDALTFSKSDSMAVEELIDDAIVALEEALAKQAQGEPTRHELQAKGEHPAPCARFCEANAFRIAERGYQRQICELSKKLEQLKQEQGEPVAIPDCGEAGHDDGCCGNAQCLPSARRTTPQQCKPLTDAEEVLQALDSCEWSLVRIHPSSWLTDEANQRMAWGVTRTLPPFCSPDGMRMWNGATAIEALKNGKAAIEAAHGIKEIA